MSVVMDEKSTEPRVERKAFIEPETKPVHPNVVKKESYLFLVGKAENPLYSDKGAILEIIEKRSKDMTLENKILDDEDLLLAHFGFNYTKDDQYNPIVLWVNQYSFQNPDSKNRNYTASDPLLIAVTSDDKVVSAKFEMMAIPHASNKYFTLLIGEGDGTKKELIAVPQTFGYERALIHKLPFEQDMNLLIRYFRKEELTAKVFRNQILNRMFEVPAINGFENIKPSDLPQQFRGYKMLDVKV
jgi:hypothetical protein